MKTAQFIEETQASKESSESAENTPSSKPKKKRGDGARIAAWKWKPGQSGNPGGRPKNDIAAQICRAVFENNAEAIYEGLAAELVAGKAYTLQVASDRAYGKLKETKEFNHTYENLSDKDLDVQIALILRKLGIAGQIDSAEPANGKAKTDGHAKDTELLPR